MLRGAAPVPPRGVARARRVAGARPTAPRRARAPSSRSRHGHAGGGARGTGRRSCRSRRGLDRAERPPSARSARAGARPRRRRRRRRRGARPPRPRRRGLRGREVARDEDERARDRAAAAASSAAPAPASGGGPRARVRRRRDAGGRPPAPRRVVELDLLGRRVAHVSGSSARSGRRPDLERLVVEVEEHDADGPAVVLVDDARADVDELLEREPSAARRARTCPAAWRPRARSRRAPCPSPGRRPARAARSSPRRLRAAHRQLRALGQALHEQAGAVEVRHGEEGQQERRGRQLASAIQIAPSNPALRRRSAAACSFRIRIAKCADVLKLGRSKPPAARLRP